MGTFGTRQEAEGAERAARAAFQTGGAVYLPLERVYRDWWVPRLHAGPLSPKTVRHYTGRMERYVLPVLGAVPLARVDGRAVDRLLTQLEFEGQLRPRTRDAVRASFRRFLRDAREEGLIVENIAARSWTPAEVDRYKRQKFRSGR